MHINLNPIISNRQNEKIQLMESMERLLLLFLHSIFPKECMLHGYYLINSP